jgi:hypothetical protein
MVAAGRGREVMLMPGWWHAITAESFLDRCTEMPDVLELAPTVRCPVLFLRGDHESAEARRVPAARAAWISSPTAITFTAGERTR